MFGEQEIGFIDITEDYQFIYTKLGLLNQVIVLIILSKIDVKPAYFFYMIVFKYLKRIRPGHSVYNLYVSNVCL